jgi:DUF1680 family protein
MTNIDGPVVHLYNPGTAEMSLQSKNHVRLVQETDYPAGDTVTITLEPKNAETFTLALRIPAWSAQNSLSINNIPWAGEIKPGDYARIRRKWASGDRVELKLDLRGRRIAEPSGKNFVALARGPIVLALDSRFYPDKPATHLEIPPMDGSHVKLVPNVSAAKKVGVRLAFDAAFSTADRKEYRITLCDFASAGNTWDDRSAYRVWLPRPLDLAAAWNHLPLWSQWGWAKERPKMPPCKSER